MTGFWYLATPYSKYPGGIELAFEHACREAAERLRRGVRVYSPIAHTHPIAIHGEIDPLSHDIWIPFDHAMMRAAEGLIVCKMEGWETSKGIAMEIEFFERLGKPITYEQPNGLKPALASGETADKGSEVENG